MRPEVLIPVLQSFCQTPFGIRSAGVGPNRKTQKLVGYYDGNWGLPKTVYEGMGLLPYRERLQCLRLMTLLERQMRGDLIKTFKIINGFVDYGHNMFGTNIAYRTRNLNVTSLAIELLKIGTIATTHAKFNKYQCL